ncbi:MAG: rhomboid family intramembrane serine protease [Clostridiales bacterium]|jgi:membrane associated rhomboid family serine protease|nr:rhomboid family intramembrane serine protease [Clostridiales bacterium]MDR2751226.1 rhomboid family intramembrane serine protease [Clostridiales bacterium]
MNAVVKFLKRFQLNSPVILTYALVSLVVLGLNMVFGQKLNLLLFSVSRTAPTDLLLYPRLILHAVGHASFSHYIGNFLVILLVGPMLEEKYGSLNLLIMMLITSVVTGLSFILLSRYGNLLGASGVAFMMILLSSFVNIQKGRIPITVVLVIILFIGQEAVAGLTSTDNISQLTHVIGGICGAVLGTYINRKKMVVGDAAQ